MVNDEVMHVIMDEGEYYLNSDRKVEELFADVADICDILTTIIDCLQRRSGSLVQFRHILIHRRYIRNVLITP